MKIFLSSLGAEDIAVGVPGASGTVDRLYATVYIMYSSTNSTCLVLVVVSAVHGRACICVVWVLAPDNAQVWLPTFGTRFQKQI